MALRKMRAMAGVLPAYAGMIPVSSAFLMRISSAPRVCGDDPSLYPSIMAGERCSPRMRG